MPGTLDVHLSHACATLLPALDAALAALPPVPPSLSAPARVAGWDDLVRPPWTATTPTTTADGPQDEEATPEG